MKMEAYPSIPNPNFKRAHEGFGYTCEPKLRALRGIAKDNDKAVAPQILNLSLFAFFAVKSSFLRALRVL
jgi:hypothetical protein